MRWIGKGIKINQQQHQEIVLGLNRIATTFEQMQELHLKWYKESKKPKKK